VRLAECYPVRLVPPLSPRVSSKLSTKTPPLLAALIAYYFLASLLSRHYICVLFALPEIDVRYVDVGFMIKVGPLGRHGLRFFMSVRMSGKGKLHDVIGVAGALLLLHDPDPVDAQEQLYWVLVCPTDAFAV
jgi:hypothetical protein